MYLGDMAGGLVTMHFSVVAVFPEMISAIARFGVLGRALNENLIQLDTWNPRDYADTKQRNIDDRPYGGTPGMVMMVHPLQGALQSAKARHQGQFKTIYLSPQGRQLTQPHINRFAQLDGLILLAGRYKGVDERLVDMEIDEEWSLGDYVISGGELAALVLIDAVSRQCPNVLGNEDSASLDSFSTGLLDCPHYTRPRDYEGREVPQVLQAGDHEKIRQWQLKQSLGRTLERRPDLLRDRNFTSEERRLLNEYAVEYALMPKIQFLEKDDD